MGRVQHPVYQEPDLVERTVRDFLTEEVDRVLIDGRSRPECAAAVLPRLAPGALVFIHDFFNAKYDPGPYHAMVLRDYDLVDAVRTGQTLGVFAPKA